MTLEPFALERYFARREFEARHVLCGSDCQTLRIRDLLDLEPGADARFGALTLGYTETRGAPELRREIAALYEHVQPDQVLVHAGAEEAIFAFMHAVLEPGDHLVVPTPCYQSLRDVARSIGCTVSDLPLDERDGWALRPEALPHLINERTRVVVINSPNNPTGGHLSLEQLRRLTEITAERGILLFSDEVYRFSAHTPEDELPGACDLGEHAVSLGVLSKSFGLPGLRIGWAATRNRAVLEAMETVKDYLTICNSGPSEFLAAIALRHRDQVLGRTRQIIRANLPRLDAFCERYRAVVGWTRPRAGPVAFPHLRGEVSATRFCDELLRARSVLLAPGSVFGHDDRHFRIGFGRSDFVPALARLEEHVEATLRRA